MIRVATFVRMDPSDMITNYCECLMSTYFLDENKVTSLTMVTPYSFTEKNVFPETLLDNC